MLNVQCIIILQRHDVYKHVRKNLNGIERGEHSDVDEDVNSNTTELVTSDARRTNGTFWGNKMIRW